MFTKIIKTCTLVRGQYKLLSSIASKLPENGTTTIIIPKSSNQKQNLTNQLEINWENELEIIKKEELKENVLDPIVDGSAIENTDRPLVPTFNLAAYVKKSKTLQELLKLGVDLSKIERKNGLPEFIIKLDFDKHIKEHLLFLQNVGVSTDKLGEFITKNPLIFKEDLANLETRINYLESKRFKPEDIQRIVERNPFWLMFNTKRIDNRLGFFQRKFELIAKDVRQLAVKSPKLITYNMEAIQKNLFSIKEEMGFIQDEMKQILLKAPKVWMLNQDSLLERWTYVHNTMNITNNQIALEPKILYSREFRIKERHEFLMTLNRAQYDPRQDLYVSLKRLVEGNNFDFVVNVAKSSLKDFDAFLRSR